MLPRLSRDRTAGERLMGVFIVIASFLLISSMILASMTSFFSIASGDFTELKGTQLIGATEYTLRNPTDGWNITADNETTHWDHEADENAYFYEDTPGEDDQMVVGFIRDNELFGASGWGQDSIKYMDFIMVYVEFGWWDNDDWPISFETLEANQVMNSNISVTEFGIRHNTTFALIITTPGPPEYFEAMLWATTFNAKIGIPDYEEDIASESMWTILGQIMTASLPDVNREINYIIGGTFWAGMGMMVFTLVSRVVPFITGG